MNPPHMILHGVYPTKYPLTPVPLTRYLWVVFGLMPVSVFLAREPAPHSLWAPFVPAKEMLAVTIIVFPKITAPTEDGV